MVVFLLLIIILIISGMLSRFLNAIGIAISLIVVTVFCIYYGISFLQIALAIGAAILLPILFYVIKENIEKNKNPTPIVVGQNPSTALTSAEDWKAYQNLKNIIKECDSMLKSGDRKSAIELWKSNSANIDRRIMDAGIQRDWAGLLRKNGFSESEISASMNNLYQGISP